MKLHDQATTPPSTKYINIFTEDGGRIFINIALSGCGNSCRYCYIDNPQAAQILIPPDDFRLTLDYIEGDQRFIAGRKGSLLSISPDSEPFKQKGSAELVLQILNRFLPMGNSIQISTKEQIPSEILENIQKNRQFQEQVVLFVSNSTIYT